LHGLQGEAEPNLDLSSLNLGPADLHLLSTLLTSFPEFTAAMNSLTISSTGNMEKKYTLHGLQGEAEPNLDLSSLNLGPTDLQFLSTLLTSFPEFTAAMHSINVMKNLIGDDGLAALMSTVKGTNINSITGIVEGQTSIDWSGQDLNPFDLKILAADIEFTHFNGAIRLDENPITGSIEGKDPDPSDSKDEGVMAQIDADVVGLAALCEAMKSSAVSTLSLSGCKLGPVGLATLTKFITNNGAIISLNVIKNPICDDGLAALMTAVKGTKIKTITGITEGQTTIDYSGQGLTPMDMKTLAADIGITPFKGAISEVNLSSNGAIGSPTGYRDKRDGSVIVAVAVKQGAFATVDGSRWGVVKFLDSGGTKAYISWLDNALAARGLCKSGFTETHTLIAAVSDKALVAHTDLSAPVFGGIEALCSGLPSTSIQRLNLSDIGLTPEGLTRLAILFTSDIINYITNFNLSSNKCFGTFNDRSLNELMTGQPVATFNDPRYSHDVDKDQAGWRAICVAFKGTAIETLVISDIGAGPVALSTLADAISDMGAIRAVNLSANKCFGVDKWGDHSVDKDQTGWAAVCGALKGNQTIKMLVLADIGAGPVALSTLADAISDMGAIEDISLDKNAIFCELYPSGNVETADKFIHQ
jgi:hypothetical protein